MLHHYFFLGLFGSLLGFLAHTDARQAIVTTDNAKHQPANSFPYLVSVLFHKRNSKRRVNVCTGGMVSHDLVITAAHCFVANNNNLRTSPLVVKAETVEVYVKTMYVLKSYRPPPNIAADIAALRLNNSLTNVALLDLPPRNTKTTSNLYEGKMAQIFSIGWKQHERGDIVNVSHCQQVYHKPNVTDKQICVKIAHHQSELHDKCFGDNGGPLVFQGTIIGILSRSPINCSQKFVVAVYTNVAEYVLIIEKILNGERNYRRIREHIY